MLVLISMVYKNSEYLFFQEDLCRKLSKYDYYRIIVDCSENSEERQRLESLPNTTIIDGAWINKYRLSEAVGVAANFMVQIAERIGTKYAVILDVDVVPLVPNWDALVLKSLDSGVDAMGIPYNPLHGSRRIMNMPSTFFFAFNTRRIVKAKLDWRPRLPSWVRNRMYWFYRKLNTYIFTNEPKKFFDFELSQFALLKMKQKGMKVVSMNIKQPWDSDSKLKFNISHLPNDKSTVDPLMHDYPEEWHFEGVLFATHQRRGRGVRNPGPVRSYMRSFNQTEYSKDWVKVIKDYLNKEYKIKIDY